MRASQLRFFDAVAYLASRSYVNTDWMAFWVFDARDGKPPSPAEIAAHFRQRAGLSEFLNRRIADVPGQVDYPYWITDPDEVENHFSHDTSIDVEWETCVD